MKDESLNPNEEQGSESFSVSKGVGGVVKKTYKKTSRARRTDNASGLLSEHESNAELKILLDSAGARGTAVRTLLEGLKATRRFWSKEASGYVEEPDHQCRTRVAEILLAYTDGRPVERSEVVKLNIDSLAELQERAKTSPALQKSLDGLMKNLKTPDVQKGVEIPTEAIPPENDPSNK